MLDVDASLVEIHSERKQGAAPHFKHGFGFHPMFCFLDNNGEALAGVLRHGNAVSDHVIPQSLGLAIR
ncbi:MAG: transposase [Actinomycetota bacterium]